MSKRLTNTKRIVLEETIKGNIVTEKLHHFDNGTYSGWIRTFTYGKVNQSVHPITITSLLSRSLIYSLDY